MSHRPFDSSQLNHTHRTERKEAHRAKTRNAGNAPENKPGATESATGRHRVPVGPMEEDRFNRALPVLARIAVNHRDELLEAIREAELVGEKP